MSLSQKDLWRFPSPVSPKGTEGTAEAEGGQEKRRGEWGKCKVVLECDHCGRMFIRKRHKVKPTGNAYCSHACRDAHIAIPNPTRKQILKAVGRKIEAAIRAGLKPKPCRVCGNPNSHAHHPNYAEPYNVVWLCRLHHNRLHHAGKPLAPSHREHIRQAVLLAIQEGRLKPPPGRWAKVGGQA